MPALARSKSQFARLLAGVDSFSCLLDDISNLDLHIAEQKNGDWDTVESRAEQANDT